MTDFSSYNQVFLVEEFKEGKISDANIHSLDLTGFDLNGMYFEEVMGNLLRLNNADLSSFRWDTGSLTQSDWIDVSSMDCQWNNLDLNGTRFLRSTWEKSWWRNVRISGSALHRCFLKNMKMEQVCFKDNEIVKFHFTDMFFKDCRFEVTQGEGLLGLREGILANSIFVNCVFVGNIFNQVEWANCIFVHCTFIGSTAENYSSPEVFLHNCEGLYNQNKPNSTDCKSDALELILNEIGESK